MCPLDALPVARVDKGGWMCETCNVCLYRVNQCMTIIGWWLLDDWQELINELRDVNAMYDRKVGYVTQVRI